MNLGRKEPKGGWMADCIRLLTTSAMAAALSSAALAQTSRSATSNLPAPAQAGAAPGESGRVSEIVVTAQRRSESLQKVPIAVTAVTGADLARSGVNNLQSATNLVPGLQLGQSLGSAQVALRGIGLENLSPGAEGSIAFHVDGVFLSRSIAALSSFYDVDQLEVLRGPQGTLYGRNATGGAINVITREPSEQTSGYVDLTGGNYGRYATDGAVSGALIPGVLLGRLAFQTDDHDGYGRNIVTGHDVDDLNEQSVRGKLIYKPVNHLSLELSADYHREADHSGGYHFLGGAGFSAPDVPVEPTGLALGGEVANNERDIANGQNPQNHVEFYGVSGKLIYDLGNNTELRSLTAYRRTTYSTQTDLDSTNLELAPTYQSEHDNQISEELQLAGKTDRLTWLTGFFYFHENDEGDLAIPFNNELVGFPAPGYQTQGYFSGGAIVTDAEALFGQATYRIFDRLRLTVGGRYSVEHKTDHDKAAFDYLTPYDPAALLDLTTLNRDKTFYAFTPRVALDYQITPSVLAYASWSKGFKSGTYNLGALQPAVDPEKVTAYETGVKSTLLDRRLRVNLAGFYYDYSNLQVSKVVGQNIVLENAASATIYGLEAEVQAQLTPQLEIDANGSWLHARFDNYVSVDAARAYGDGVTIDPQTNAPAFNLAGNTLPQAPDFTFFVGAQYRWPTEAGEFSLRGELSWRDRSYFTPFDLNYVSQAAYNKVNAFVNWVEPDRRWSVSVFVKNLTNKTTVSDSYVGSALVGFPVNGYLDDPRTYGVTVGYKF